MNTTLLIEAEYALKTARDMRMETRIIQFLEKILVLAQGGAISTNQTE